MRRRTTTAGPRGRRRRATVLLLTIGLVAAGLVGAAAQAQDRWKDPNVVALGDSYASGEGTYVYYSDSGACHRSPHSWQDRTVLPSGVTSHATGMTFASCSGATTATVAGSQLGGLSTKTDYVLLSVGGNDAFFAEVLEHCAGVNTCLDRSFTTHDGTVLPAPLRTSLPAYVSTTVRAKMLSLLRQVHAKSPNAMIVWAGYPRVLGFADEPCPGVSAGLLFGTPAFRSFVDTTAATLETAQKEAANTLASEGGDIQFVSTASSFRGHSACATSRDRWINAYAGPGRPESFHPSISGYDTYTTDVSNSLRSTRHFGRHLVKSTPVGIKYLTDGADSAYGLPTGDEGTTKNADGLYQKFGSAVILQKAGKPAYAVPDPMWDKYRSLGSEWKSGGPGYPTSDEYCTLKSGNSKIKGCGQRFEHDTFWTSKKGTFFSRGKILARYAKEKWETSKLGFPVTDHKCGLTKSGCYERFEGGAIYYTSKTKARVLKGDIYSKWKKTGYEKGRLGYPTGEQKCIHLLGCKQYFQKGSIHQLCCFAPREVHGKIYTYWKDHGGDSGEFGWPEDDEMDCWAGNPLVEGRMQHFQYFGIFVPPGGNPRKMVDARCFDPN